MLRFQRRWPDASGRQNAVVVLLGVVAAWAAAVINNPQAKEGPRAAPIFREVASEVGLDFWHFTGATGEYYFPENMGAGVALLDYDNDGDLDVYLVQGMMLGENKHPLFPPPAGWKPGNRLFRNMLSETGKLSFVDVTDQAGVGQHQSAHKAPPANSSLCSSVIIC